MNWPGAGWAGDPVLVVEYCSAPGDGSTVDVRVAQPRRAVQGDEAVATGVVASPHRTVGDGHADTGEENHASCHDIGEPAHQDEHEVPCEGTDEDVWRCERDAAAGRVAGGAGGSG
jgi:hypothetical protein